MYISVFSDLRVHYRNVHSVISVMTEMYISVMDSQIFKYRRLFCQLLFLFFLSVPEAYCEFHVYVTPIVNCSNLENLHP